MYLLPEPTFKPLRVYSDGAGTQSVAALVLQSQGKINFDVFVFANVGEDSENPATLKYRHEVVIPFAERHGIKLIERQKTRFGQPDTVYQATLRDNKSIPIPIMFPDRGFGKRTCTEDHKVQVVQDYIKKETKATHAVMAIGFSADEQARIYKKYRGWHDRNWVRDKNNTWRANKTRLGFWRLYEFPLATLGLNRAACEVIIAAAGLPPVPPSACWFCPFLARSVHIERKAQNDPLHYQSIEFQNAVNEKYQRILGSHPKASPFVAIHRDGIRLEDVPNQRTLWDDYQDVDESCTVGVCGL